MNWWWILVIIIAVLLALSIFQALWTKNVKNAKIVGGSSLVENIMITIKPYIKEVGTAKYLNEYLSFVLEHNSKKKLSTEKLVEKAIDHFDVNNVDDFLDKTGFSYACLLPSNKRCFVLEAYMHIKPRDLFAKDIKSISALLDDYFYMQNIRLHGDKLRKHSKKLLSFYRIYKLREPVAGKPLAKIREMLKKSPEKVFTPDLIGLRPVIRRYAARYSKKGDKDLIKQISRDLTLLKIENYHPRLDVSSLEDLAERLRTKVALMSGRKLKTSNWWNELMLQEAESKRIRAETEKKAAFLKAEEESFARRKVQKQLEESDHREAQRLQAVFDEESREPLPVETPAQEPLPVEMSLKEPLPVETPAQEPLPVETPTQEPLPVETPTQEPLPVEMSLQEPLPVETPAQEPLPVEMAEPELTNIKDNIL